MLGHRLALELGGRPGLTVHATVRRAVPEAFRPERVEYVENVEIEAGRAEAVLHPLLGELCPDVIVNAVGAIKQRDLGSAVERTFAVNGLLPHLLAVANPNDRGRVIHVSTDCVFKGDLGGYREADVPDAQDVYGRSKAVGELDYGRHLTLRTSIVGFEIVGHLGLLSWFFRQARGAVLRGYRRAVYSGLPTGVLSRLIADLAEDPRDLSGLWHVASEPITKFDLLDRVNRRFDLGHTLQPDDSVTIDRSLNDDRFRAAMRLPRPTWDALLDDLARDWERWPYAPIYADLRARGAAA